jgi:hypothetical protein
MSGLAARQEMMSMQLQTDVRLAAYAEHFFFCIEYNAC